MIDHGSRNRTEWTRSDVADGPPLRLAVVAVSLGMIVGALIGPVGADDVPVARAAAVTE